MKAYSLIREQPHYRRQAFDAGLKNAGFEVIQGTVGRARPGDVLVIWNRYASFHEQATIFEKEGGTVLVAENGYIGKGGTSPKFDVAAGGTDQSYYAFAAHHHNGGGVWPVGGPERFEALGLDLKPWRQGGEYILVCPNRSFGVPGRMMHPDWAERCAERLRKAQPLPVRVRPHPGNNAPVKPLAEDLAGAAAVVIWSSSAGVHALVAGIPVVCEAPFWVAKPGAFSRAAELERFDPVGTDIARRAALERMAWAQWTISEIETGEPVRQLLSAARQG